MYKKKLIELTADGKRPKAIISFLIYLGYELEFKAKFESEATKKNYIMRSFMICTAHPIFFG